MKNKSSVLVEGQGNLPIPRGKQPMTKQAKMVLLSIIVVSVAGLGLGAKISYETPGAAISGCSNDTDLAGWDQVKFLKFTDSGKTATIDDWPGSGASYQTITCTSRRANASAMAD
jgi:hypothetical protein